MWFKNRENFNRSKSHQWIELQWTSNYAPQTSTIGCLHRKLCFGFNSSALSVNLFINQNVNYFYLFIINKHFHSCIILSLNKSRDFFLMNTIDYHLLKSKSYMWCLYEEQMSKAVFHEDKWLRLRHRVNKTWSSWSSLGTLPVTGSGANFLKTCSDSILMTPTV